MANLGKLLPVRLQSFPACDDCISWSQDNIAVAGGELVYILTPKSSSPHADIAGHPQWKTLTLRANLFRQDEWPEPNLATISNYSIGEEQSNSPVVGLSWSSPGLGQHRSSILGVLTSNLLLSLWETDGHTGHYKRTCIVNHIPALERLARKDKTGRRAGRVRSFTWLPPLKNASTSRWGHHYLAIANDEGAIIFLRITRNSLEVIGREAWSFDIGLELCLADFGLADTDPDVTSSLQQRLYHQAPIIKVRVAPWADTKMSHGVTGMKGWSERSDTDIFLSTVTIERGSNTHSASICASISRDGQQASMYRDETARYNDSLSDWQSSVASPRHFVLVNDEQTSTSAVAVTDNYFSEVVQPLRNEFDSTYRLSGHVQTKFWGSAVSFDGTRAVTCITLHPSDMIEYNIPSAEKCFLVFKNTQQTKTGSDGFSLSIESVQEQILRYARQALTQSPSIDSLFDQKMCQAYINLARMELPPASELRSSLEVVWRRALVQSVAGSDRSATPDGIDIRADSTIESEDCDICGSAIAFTDDTTVANCAAGHQLARCQISFLAIQEPGVSKYCSQCGKQFLDLPKLGSARGSSFAQLVFTEFDICPYCQGKYRG